jgi:hypothetical protein
MPAGSRGWSQWMTRDGEALKPIRALPAVKAALDLLDPREASAIGHRALDDAGQLRSRRAADDLRELRGLAHSRAAIPEVAELQHRITTLAGPG